MIKENDRNYKQQCSKLTFMLGNSLKELASVKEQLCSAEQKLLAKTNMAHQLQEQLSLVRHAKSQLQLSYKSVAERIYRLQRQSEQQSEKIRQQLHRYQNSLPQDLAQTHSDPFTPLKNDLSLTNPPSQSRNSVDLERRNRELVQDLQSLRTKLQSEHQQVQSKERVIEELQSRLKEWRESSSEQESASQQWLQMKLMFLNQIEALQTKNQVLKVQLTELHSANQTFELQYAERIAHIQTQLDLNQEKTLSLLQEKEQLQLQLQQLRDCFASQKKSHEASDQQVQEQVGRYRQLVKNYEEELQKLNLEMHKSRQTNLSKSRDLEQSLQNQERYLHSLQNQASDLKDFAHRSADQNKELRRLNQKLKQKQQSLLTQLKTKQNVIESQRVKGLSQQRQVQQLRTQLLQAQARMTQQRHKADQSKLRLKRELASLDERVKSQNQKMQRLLDQMQVGDQLHRQKVQTLSLTIEDLKAEIQKLYELRQNQQRQSRQLIAQKEEAVHSLQKMVNMLELQSTRNRSSLQRIIDDLTLENSKLKDQHRSLDSACQQVTSRWRASQEHAGVFSEKLDSALEQLRQLQLKYEQESSNFLVTVNQLQSRTEERTRDCGVLEEQLHSVRQRCQDMHLQSQKLKDELQFEKSVKSHLEEQLFYERRRNSHLQDLYSRTKSPCKEDLRTSRSVSPLRP